MLRVSVERGIVLRVAGKSPFLTGVQPMRLRQPGCLQGSDDIPLELCEKYHCICDRAVKRCMVRCDEDGNCPPGFACSCDNPKCSAEEVVDATMFETCTRTPSAIVRKASTQSLDRRCTDEAMEMGCCVCVRCRHEGAAVCRGRHSSNCIS